jgi:hypothetical protein
MPAEVRDTAVGAVLPRCLVLQLREEQLVGAAVGAQQGAVTREVEVGDVGVVAREEADLDKLDA